MAKTIEQLKAQSAEVKNASVIGENTATRVGSLFNDIVEHVEAYEAGQAQKDTEQSTSINAETSRATAAETTLSERINQEVTDRKAMDETIGVQLSNEIERAKGMELGISTKLNDEIERAQEAENNLQEQITSEAEARDLAINAEAQARSQNDQLLSQAIAAEQERAEAAEQANATAIDAAVTKNEEQDQKLSELDKKIPLKETDEEGFYLTNEEGNVIAMYKDGKWIFASTIEEISLDNIITAIQNLNQSFEHFDVLKDTEEEGFSISNEYGDVIAKYVNDKWYFGEIDSKTINDIIESIQENLVSIEESGFAICNEYGEAIAKYDNVWNFSGTSIGKKENGCINISHIDMNIGTKVILLGSNSVQNNKSMVFSGVINGTFNGISLGHGYKGYFLSSWIDVTSTDIIVHNYTSTEAIYTYPHGLTIENNIQVIITVGYQDKKIKIVSNGYSFEQDITGKYIGAALDVWIKSSSELKDCSMSWACPKLQDGVWIFGDSFYTLGDNKRWPTHLFNDGFTNSIVVAHSGETDLGALISLNTLLQIATPKCIVWGLGMNDHDISTTEYNQNWKNSIDKVIKICRKNNIQLILATIPSAKQDTSTEGAAPNDAIHEAKNAHIKTLGIRYIDFAKAVGATSEGIWYDGMKEDTGVHPTEKGAIALYMQAVADAPEIMI